MRAAQRHTAAAWLSNRRLAIAVGAALVLAVLLSSALDPAPAQAINLNPIDGIKDLAGKIPDAAGSVGAGVLKDALEWLLGGLQGTITLALVKFLVTVQLPVGGTLSKATGPIIVIGGYFLVIGLVASVADGYREVIAGADTAQRVIGAAIFRVIGLAVLLGAWFWIVPLAVDVANGLTGYVLSDPSIGHALRRAFASGSLLSAGSPILGVILGIFLAVAILTLIVLKFMLAIAFAILYVGGPALIGFSAFPRVGRLPLAILTRGLATVTLVPFAWTVVFVAWAGVSAGTFDTITGKGSGIVNALMGPGLFLAAIVMLLAVTKKTLAVATFGMPLKIPGAGLARMATRTLVGLGVAGGVGAAKGATAAGTAAGKAESAAAAQLRGQPNDATPQAGGRQATASGQSGGQPTGQGARRQLKEGEVGRHQQRLGENQDRQRREDVAADAFGKVRKDATGWDTSSREPAPEQGQAARARADELRAGGVPDEQLAGASAHIPEGNRSAMAGSAQRAINSHPADPERAYRQFRDTTVRHTAAANLTSEQRQAVEQFTAAGPERTWEAFGDDHAKFSWGDGGGEQPTSRGGFDTRLMGERGGLAAFKRDNGPQNDDGDLVF